MRGRAESSPLEAPSTRELYREALRRLPRSDQEAIAARLEEGLPYEEIARLLGKDTPEAARAQICAALVRLAKEIRQLRTR